MNVLLQKRMIKLLTNVVRVSYMMQKYGLKLHVTIPVKIVCAN